MSVPCASAMPNRSTDQSLLVSTHLQDLIETTSMVHYEAFRSKQLLGTSHGCDAAARETDFTSPAALKESSAAKQQAHQQSTAA